MHIHTNTHTSSQLYVKDFNDVHIYTELKMPAVDVNKSWFGVPMNVWCLDPKDLKKYSEHYIYARLTNTMRCLLTI